MPDELPQAPSRPPAARPRLLVALAIGALGALGSYAATRLPGFAYQDFAAWYLAAEALVQGGDPFAATARVFESGLLYPFPAVLVTIPFTPLPLPVAGALFVGITSALLAWLLTREAWWPLVAFASGAYFHAFMVAQWSMLLLAGAIGGWAWLVAIKPNMGVAIALQHLRWRSFTVGLAVLLASLLLLPWWTRQWLENTSGSTAHFALWRTGWGLVVLAAWLRWRRPEARLLGALAILPISPLTYDLLLLFAIPRSRREAMLLAATTSVAFAYLGTRGIPVGDPAYLRDAGTAALLGGYLPALALVLRRSNEGALPAWLERWSAWLPRWIRGEAPA